MDQSEQKVEGKTDCPGEEKARGDMLSAFQPLR